MPTPIGGTQAIAAGIALQGVAFAGTVVTPYQVLSITPGWATTPFVDPASKIASGFTAQFTVPAPAGGSSFDWQVLAPTPAATSLATYLDDLRDLLNDFSDLYWRQGSPSPKVRYINRALQKRDRDTGQNRVLISFVTTIGVDTYNFTQLGNTNVFDLIGVNLLYQNLRYVMGCVSFSELNARLRLYQPVFQSAPVAYARYGPQQFVVAPAPSVAYTLELDCSQVTPPDYLVALTDTDPLPEPFGAPVKYWAAYLAKINERAYDEAQWFKDQYEMEIAKLDSNKVGMVPSLYGGIGSMWRR
jgi:hypothetical protein